MQKSTAAHAALLYALTPIGVYVYSLLEGARRRARVPGWACSSPSGVCWCCCSPTGLRALHGVFVGDLLILGAVGAWVVYTAEGKAFIGEHGPLRATALVDDCRRAVAASRRPLGPPAGVRARSKRTVKGAIAYLALLTSVVSYLLWYWALGRTDASKVAVFSNLQPVATAVAAWLVLGEHIGWEVAVGGALVLAGVRLTGSARAVSRGVACSPRRLTRCSARGPPEGRLRTSVRLLAC